MEKETFEMSASWWLLLLDMNSGSDVRRVAFPLCAACCSSSFGFCGFHCLEWTCDCSAGELSGVIDSGGEALSGPFNQTASSFGNRLGNVHASVCKSSNCVQNWTVWCCFGCCGLLNFSDNWLLRHRAGVHECNNGEQNEESRHNGFHFDKLGVFLCVLLQKQFFKLWICTWDTLIELWMWNDDQRRPIQLFILNRMTDKMHISLQKCHYEFNDEHVTFGKNNIPHSTSG